MNISNPAPQAKNDEEVKILQEQVTKQQKQIEELHGMFETVMRKKLTDTGID